MEDIDITYIYILYDIWFRGGGGEEEGGGREEGGRGRRGGGREGGEGGGSPIALLTLSSQNSRL